jgi:hypothetical protein
LLNRRAERLCVLFIGAVQQVGRKGIGRWLGGLVGFDIALLVWEKCVSCVLFFSTDNSGF